METPSPNRRIVAVVDDDESLRAALRSLLGSIGVRVEAFASAEDFLGFPWIADAACLVLDLRMTGMSGLDLQRGLRAAGLQLPTIFSSAHDDPTVRRLVASGGALAFLRKPFAGDALIDAMRSTLGLPPSVGRTDRR